MCGVNHDIDLLIDKNYSLDNLNIQGVFGRIKVYVNGNYERKY